MPISLSLQSSFSEIKHYQLSIDKTNTSKVKPNIFKDVFLKHIRKLRSCSAYLSCLQSGLACLESHSARERHKVTASD